MIELLKQIGVPSLAIILIFAAVYVLKELWANMKITRIKVSQDVLQKILEELDTQINEFYLPLRQRLEITFSLFESTKDWTINNERFDNGILEIKSEDNRALAKIVNHRMFFPLNKEAEDILLTKTHLKHDEDKTDYNKLLLHFLKWRAFEEAVIDNDIESYNGASFLPFPSEETINQRNATEFILTKRDEIRSRILKLQSATNNINSILLKRTFNENRIKR